MGGTEVVSKQRKKGGSRKREKTYIDGEGGRERHTQSKRER